MSWLDDQQCQWSKTPSTSTEEPPEEDPFVEAFLDACHAGDLPKTQEAINSGRLTVDDLNEGLALATSGAVEQVYADIVSILFDAVACITTEAVTSLPGDSFRQQPSVIRQYLDHGLDPNSRLSNGEPLIGKNPLERTMGDRPAAPVLAELLLAHGARLEPELLFLPLVGRKSSGTVMTKFLLDRGLDPNTISETWGTPLHLAVYRNMLSSYC
ncbi:uncharacterized protein RAG0_13019 [Rhynchosporium agropyri]|uniref:Uncharacterized protein n=1 Tax=Rhynchosporium agropyri TaxID=914238 RepID=A0A1E1LAU1_9HELO|nr:uncharacterized protein RAG0_13019 [Rhynchosporium agropyri]